MSFIKLEYLFTSTKTSPEGMGAQRRHLYANYKKGRPNAVRELSRKRGDEMRIIAELMTPGGKIGTKLRGDYLDCYRSRS